MSADNWTSCPACFAGALKKFDTNHADIMRSYGKIPVEEFDAHRDALVKPTPDDFRTFREDYEFYGAENGTVVASYSGSCTNCGIGVEFNHERKFWPEATS